jgi:hypothetical protein
MAAIPRYFKINLSVKDVLGQVFSGEIAFSKRAKRKLTFEINGGTQKSLCKLCVNTAVLPKRPYTPLYCQVFLPGADFFTVYFYLPFPDKCGASTAATGRHYRTSQFNCWSARLTRID